MADVFEQFLAEWQDLAFRAVLRGSGRPGGTQPSDDPQREPISDPDAITGHRGKWAEAHLQAHGLLGGENG
jgi:hypothetical protein